MQFSDGELVEEALSGSAVAFEQLMSRYERLVFKIALSCTGQRESAMDVLQNVFLKVHLKLDSFQIEGNFKNWIARITMNESVNWKRSQKRHLADELNETTPVVSPPIQDDSLQDRETWEMIKRSMGMLKPLYCAAIAMRYFEGMSIREIASALKCREGTVKSMLFRSLQQMKLNMGVSKEVAS